VDERRSMLSRTKQNRKTCTLQAGMSAHSNAFSAQGWSSGKLHAFVVLFEGYP